MARKRKPTTDAVEILHRRFYAGRPQRIAEVEEARANDDIARQIASLRRNAGLTQKELGGLVGTTASVICRLENADYQLHSLALLCRIEIRLRHCESPPEGR
jgi:ribosome-binding protein aMBF1 (putative translation factor)